MWLLKGKNPTALLAVVRLAGVPPSVLGAGDTTRRQTTLHLLWSLAAGIMIGAFSAWDERTN